MPDKPKDEQLDNTPDDQPEIPSSEINPVNDTETGGDEQLLNLPETQAEKPLRELNLPEDNETVIPNQKTDNMEAHHHPDLHHKPKKW